MESQISTKVLKKLKQKLPHGGMKKISQCTGFDVSTVSKVLNGKFKNKEIIDEAVKIVQQCNNENSELHNLINNL